MMKLEMISIEDAKRRCRDFKWVLAELLSEKLLEKSSDAVIDWDELYEARFFDSTGELHVFYREDELCAVLSTPEQGDRLEFAESRLAGKFKQAAGSAILCRLLDSDEDGQTVVKHTILYDLKAGEGG